jgi:DNA-binding transcriptional LysR family regulator
MSSHTHRLSEPRPSGASFLRHIPIDILQTFSTVADLRSQVRAAHALGLSQPTVSMHIKRLQDALAVEVFDRSVAGITLTPIGKLILTKAKSLLELHDEIVATCSRNRPLHVIRVGVHNSFMEAMLPAALKRCRVKYPSLCFHTASDTSDNLIAALQENELDIILAITIAGPLFPSRHQWHIELGWTCAQGFEASSSSPIPLVAYSGNSQLTQVAMGELEKAGVEFEIVYSSSSSVSLIRAVQDGWGIAAMPREAMTRNLAICESERLPTLPNLVCGLYRRPMNDAGIVDDVADAIAEQVSLAESPLSENAA